MPKSRTRPPSSWWSWGGLRWLRRSRRKSNVEVEGIHELMKLYLHTNVKSLDEAHGGGADLSAIKNLEHETFSLPIEDRIWLEQAMDTLSEVQREVIHPFFYKDLTQTEIGKKLGLPQRKVSRLVASAIKKLSRSGKDERGFTLPELMIVIVLLGILAAIAIPSWWGIVESREVESAKNQLVADLRLSHTRATNQLTEYHFVYMPDGSALSGCSNADYCLVRETSSGPYEETPRFLPDGTEISGTTVQANDALATLFGSNPRMIRFEADGLASAPGGLVGGATTPAVSVDPEDGAPTYDIEVNTATSRVEIASP